MMASITLRPIQPEDMTFLYEVYASTRQEELAMVKWDEAQKTTFLQMQFAAQHTYYQENYTNAAFLVILLENRPVGRLYVARWAEEIRLMDVALLPAYRGAGIGSGLVHALMAEAAQADKPLRIHVEKHNPALRLYERLGFQSIADRGVYWFLEWSPTVQLNTAS